MTSETVTYGASKIGGLANKPVAAWMGSAAKGTKRKGLADRLTAMRAAGAFKKGQH